MEWLHIFCNYQRWKENLQSTCTNCITLLNLLASGLRINSFRTEEKYIMQRIGVVSNSMRKILGH